MNKHCTLTKIVPNANLLSIKGFGEVLLGCPSDVIKPLIQEKRFPDYCVLTLRTLRQGRNLLDIEFLFYMIAFFRHRAGEKFRFVCTSEQRVRILRILKETLNGPSLAELFGAYLPPSAVGLPPRTRRRLSDTAFVRRQDTRMGVVGTLLRRIGEHRELQSAFRQGLADHLTSTQLVRAVRPFFDEIEGVKPKKEAATAKAWVKAMLMRQECDHFGPYPQNPEAAVEAHIDFVLFNRHNEAVLRTGKREIIIRQEEPCLFEIAFGKGVRGKPFEVDMRTNEPPILGVPKKRTPFVPPELGVTYVGTGTGFSPGKHTTCNIAWIGGSGVAVDLMADSVRYMRRLGISRGDVLNVILTHVHGDHDAGLFQRLVDADKIQLLTTRIIYENFLRKAEAVTCIPQAELEHIVDFVELKPGRDCEVPGIPHLTIRCAYMFHPVPTLGVILSYQPPRRVKMSIAFSGDTLFDPELLDDLCARGVIPPDRRDCLLNFIWDADMVLHEAGGPPIHTQLDVLANLPPAVKQKVWVNHLAQEKGRYRGLRVAREGQTVVLLKGKPVQGKRQDIDTLRSTGLFDHLSTRAMGRLLRQGRVVRRRAGDVVLREGEKGDEFFIILSGMAVATKSELLVNEYERGDFFGELAIVSPDGKRRATVVAQTDMRLFRMTGDLYRAYNLPRLEETNMYDLVNFFSEHMTPTLLSSLAVGEVEQFSRGEDIVLLGARDTTAYVLLSGVVEAVDAADAQIGVLKDVDVFGEIAALERVPRTATVRAITDVKVLKLRERQFCELLRRFPSFYATVMQKKRNRLRELGLIDRILREDFGYR